MIKDRSQKDLLYKHFRAQGWLAQIEVSVTPNLSVSRSTPQITDIDVLAIRPTPDLKWNYVIGDCKTKKRESPINRVLWARGLREAVDATSAIVLLDRQDRTRIELDHKLVADEHNILLVQEDEFSVYDRAIVFPMGSSGFTESVDSLEKLRNGIGQRYVNLAELSNSIMSSYWSITDHSVLLRRSLAELLQHRGEIDPRRDEHLALVVEACIAFSVALASLVGTIFRRHIHPQRREHLEEAARVIVWGGRDQYEFFESIRRQFVDEAGRPLAPLTLPEWSKFLELLRVLLETPRLAFRIPPFLRRLSISLVEERNGEFNVGESDRIQIQLSLRVIDYVCRASGLPRDAIERLRTILLRRATEATPRPLASQNSDQGLASNRAAANDDSVETSSSAPVTHTESEVLLSNDQGIDASPVNEALEPSTDS